MKTFTSACIIFAVCIAASLQDTPFFPCDKGAGTASMFLPKGLRIKGCDTSPCKFHNGIFMPVEVDFQIYDYVKSLSVHVMVVHGMTYLYHDTEACRLLVNNKCPLYADDEATYKFIMEPPNYPVTVEFRMFNQDKELQVCFELAFDKY